MQRALRASGAMCLNLNTRPHQPPSAHGRGLGRGAGFRSTPTQFVSKEGGSGEEVGESCRWTNRSQVRENFQIKFWWLGGELLDRFPTPFLESFSDPRARVELEFWAQFPTPILGSFSDPKNGVVFRPALLRRIRIYIVKRKLVPFSDPVFGVGKRHQIWGRKLSPES